MQRLGHVRILGLAMLCTAFLAVPAHSFYVLPEYEQVPVERLIRNLEAALAADPRNVQALVNLARTHAIAYSLKSDIATVVKDLQQYGWVDAPGSEQVPFDRPVDTSDPARRRAAQRHLDAALGLYEQATRLAPEDLVIRLGLAWLTERSGATQRALQMYRDIITQDWAKEPASMPTPPQPADGAPGVVYVELTPLPDHDSVIPEAASYLIPLLDARRDNNEIAQLRERIRIVTTPRGRPITPIAVPLRADLHAADLEDRSARVSFDADGSGLRKCWTWITADAAWLVHLRQSGGDRPGEVSSALQLFGNVTFWLFWNNGYDALAVLDDDRDGTLRAAELAALGLWHDANGNGISEPQEVRSLAAHGIVALNYRYQRDEQHPDRIAYAPAGVTFADGSTRATYDLLLHPR